MIERKAMSQFHHNTFVSKIKSHITVFRCSFWHSKQYLNMFNNTLSNVHAFSYSVQITARTK